MLHPSSTYAAGDVGWPLIVCLVLPSLAFWLFAGGLHLVGANKDYRGKVTVRDMVMTQLFIDCVQLLASVPRLFIEEHALHLTCDWRKLIVGILVIDIVEYSCHRAMHTVSFLKPIHKRHHNLMPVHTLGAYYNSTFEAAFVGIILGVSAVGIFKLTILEISIVASIGAMMTVIDHTPKRFWKSKWREVKQHRRASSDPAYPREECATDDEEQDDMFGFSDHEIHHNVCPGSNFSQPFSPLLDYVFGTRFIDVMNQTGQDPKDVLRRARDRRDRQGKENVKPAMKAIMMDDDWDEKKQS
ncbi:hypothetical protein TrLO_g4082 [Triparma laevis f. longispina]|uniref:Fatty acid hydroxylase domain-containing protein n=1 Tax=Triparma laevis f. longispina TaxID=1714387 RepID=A0A9W7CL48_9STRA|nr:hypothetical protein TrLO_g4082 [Triparma laevis f. longispina]